ncbi:MAG: 2TM domain-containing protein [Burkholderiaceae bacterium]
MQTHTPSEDQIDRIARRRAGAKLGWYAHAIVYIAVNTLLATLAFMSGRNWAVFPLLGWGLGLAVHGFVVFMITGGGGLYAKLLEGERRQLQSQRDAW